MLISITPRGAGSASPMTVFFGIVAVLSEKLLIITVNGLFGCRSITPLAIKDKRLFNTLGWFCKNRSPLVGD